MPYVLYGTTQGRPMVTRLHKVLIRLIVLRATALVDVCMYTYIHLLNIFSVLIKPPCAPAASVILEPVKSLLASLAWNWMSASPAPATKTVYPSMIFVYVLTENHQAQCASPWAQSPTSTTCRRSCLLREGC